jgi:transcriptional regulator with XRE-family HTH domain
MSLGKNIGNVRFLRNQTRVDLGVKSSLGETRVRQYENNYALPHRNILYKLTKALKIRPVFLRDFITYDKKDTYILKDNPYDLENKYVDWINTPFEKWGKTGKMGIGDIQLLSLLFSIADRYGIEIIENKETAKCTVSFPKANINDMLLAWKSAINEYNNSDKTESDLKKYLEFRFDPPLENSKKKAKEESNENMMKALYDFKLAKTKKGRPKNDE